MAGDSVPGVLPVETQVDQCSTHGLVTDRASDDPLLYTNLRQQRQRPEAGFLTKITRRAMDKGFEALQSVAIKHAIIALRPMRFFLQAADPFPLKRSYDIPYRLVTAMQLVSDLLGRLAFSAQQHDMTASDCKSGFGLGSPHHGSPFVRGKNLDSLEVFHADEFISSAFTRHIISCGFALEVTAT